MRISRRLRRPAIGLFLAAVRLWAVDAYQVSGRIVPKGPAAVYLHGAITPFTASVLADARGRFHFRDVTAGTYTLAVFIVALGETRRTIEVGPSLADARGRVSVTVEVSDNHLEVGDSPQQRSVVSTRQLSIPDRAHREYYEAQKKLAHRDVPAAIAHLEHAVALAPQFAAAWNHLGTIAYQSARYRDAERFFRTALAQDASSFEPMVNLGGVLLNLGELDEALQYNLYAVLSRPRDALANSQLGMTYFALNELTLAQKYLEAARRLDPAHFSHPQLTLAEVHLRRHEPAEAAGELEDFLRQHPDSPRAAAIREAITKLRNPIN
jgi:tetratricopeptide (TPR) repeat protein